MVLTFSTLIYLLLKKIKWKNYEIYIDREYIGYDQFIKNKIVELFKNNAREKFDIHKLHIVNIGRSANAHRVANFSANGKIKSSKIMANEILNLILK
ncbi:MAG: hypothetical protein CEN91_232 [Candidatus Berkelbacteria bacterium Licking1014_85]|uniref:Uncharacterized protein n=1 Tax=Candidatus Berkelbacteria bacterium Licking1014_85 TaxID=2017148 RepID=A0A554LKX8_9BACT|nr:MAG: hypothetical protein CEN91_232 [Candidatus Berkelbacteria bacterium Licking1014_85]